MPTFPTLSSGSMSVSSAINDEAMAMYPSTVSHSFNTRVIQFLGDQEQRWTVRGELFDAVLEYQRVNGYDLSIIRAFFRSQRGMYVNLDLTSTFDITIFGQNYQYCCFDQDELSVTSDQSNTYSFSLRIKQLRAN